MITPILKWGNGGLREITQLIQLTYPELSRALMEGFTIFCLPFWSTLHCAPWWLTGRDHISRSRGPQIVGGFSQRGAQAGVQRERVWSIFKVWVFPSPVPSPDDWLHHLPRGHSTSGPDFVFRLPVDSPSPNSRLDMIMAVEHHITI